MEIDLLKAAYQAEITRANRLRETLAEQIGQLLSAQGITLGVPIESRVKSWASLEEKLDRKSLDLKSITDLDDLVGVRTILLFRRDIETVGDLLDKTFEVLSVEDTALRLTEAQFGYQSRHYILQLPQSWLQIPTFSDLDGLKAEIQVRTIAQHIWAAASHKLQYKQEESVPQPLRRSIYRVSALLETVDLEFERLLDERRIYIDRDIDSLQPTEPLNVDLVASILSEVLPPENKGDSEPYADLLDELLRFKVNTASQLRELIQRNFDAIMLEEAKGLQKRRENKDYAGTNQERTDRGVFFVHVGLARQALQEEFGAAFNEYTAAKRRKRREST